MIVLPHRDWVSYYAPTSDVHGFDDLIRLSNVPRPLVYGYCSGLIVSVTEAQKKDTVRIAKVEMSVLFFSFFLRVARSGPVKRPVLSLVIKECDGKGVLMCLLKAKIKTWFDSGIRILTNPTKVDQTLPFVAKVRLTEVDWDALGSYELFPYEYMTRKLSRVGGSPPMNRKLGDGTKEKIDETVASRLNYGETFATKSVSFEFAETIRYQKFDEKMGHFEVPWLDEQQGLAKQRSSPVPSVVEWGQVPRDTDADVAVADDDVQDWEPVGAVGFTGANRVGTMRHLSDF